MIIIDHIDLMFILYFSGARFSIEGLYEFSLFNYFVTGCVIQLQVCAFFLHYPFSFLASVDVLFVNK